MSLTKADDYPIHQTSKPVSEVGSERNFYDRYFFNGYSKTDDIYFGAVLCVYPNLNIMDGAFTLAYKGCLLYTSPSPRDGLLSRMPSSA